MNLESRYPPARKGTVVVWGLLASFPFGGMVWQVLHYLAGLRRLGFDVWYVEDSGIPLLDPSTLARTADHAGNVAFLARNMEAIGLGDRWIFRPPGSAETCLGARDPAGLESLYRETDVVINLCGSQWLKEEHRGAGAIVYLQTDPVQDQVRLAQGDPGLSAEFERYDYLFTYGENLGRPGCPVPDGGFRWLPTRPPVIPEWWDSTEAPGAGSRLTTITNWKHEGKDITWEGHRYRWRKDVQFRRFSSLPAHSPIPLELAVERIRDDDVAEFEEKGWRIVSARALSDPDEYRRYIQDSKGEFTIAKEQYVLPRTGWFSDRSVCYLAAGRPVVTQDTGFGDFVPTGEGLFAFQTQDQAIQAIQDIARDYARHSSVSREIARAYFGTGPVLSDMMSKIGIL